MSAYFVHWSDSPLLTPYLSYLREFGALKFSHIEIGAHKLHRNEGIEINYVIGGTYHWHMEGVDYQLLPGDTFVTCPWQEHGSLDQILNKGVLSWLILKPEVFTPEGNLELGDWSALSRETQREIGSILTQNRNPVIPGTLNIIDFYRQLNRELVRDDMGKEEMIHAILDKLLLTVARGIVSRGQQENRAGDFLTKLEASMKECFAHKINMTEMAYHYGMSPTSFNNKVKALTGLSPASYLIDLKIRHAKKLLKQSEESMTDIAMICGFYSSQHFSTIFADRTGMSPSAYRRKAREGIS